MYQISITPWLHLTSYLAGRRTPAHALPLDALGILVTMIYGRQDVWATRAGRLGDNTGRQNI